MVAVARVLSWFQDVILQETRYGKFQKSTLPKSKRTFTPNKIAAD